MTFPVHPHSVARVTLNQTRDRLHAARVRCVCGALFYGASRLDALDAYTPHVIADRNARAFLAVGAQA